MLMYNYVVLFMRVRKVRENRKTYNQYVKLAHSGNLTPFSHFITKAVDESLTTLISAYEVDDKLIQEGSLA